MSALFENGRIVDLILVIVAAEVALALLLGGRLASERRRSLLVYLASGAALLAALRLALVDAWWGWIAAALLLALAFHLVALRQCLQAPLPAPPRAGEVGPSPLDERSR